MQKNQSICQKDEKSQNQVPLSTQQANLKQNMSEQSKKIKKLSPKRGRPPRETEKHQYDQYLIPQLQDKWFGNQISSDLIIYLSQQGSLTIKAKTGPKPKMNAEITSQQKSKIKQFRQRFRKELQKKIQIILKYLSYKSDRTFLLLSDNKQTQEQFILDNNQFSSMNNVLKLLDQSFIISFRLIVQMLINNHDQNEFNKIQDIINQLKEHREQHKMIFDLQLIQTLIEDDFQILNNMENQIMAEQYCSLQVKVPQIDFTKGNGMNLIESIYNQSSWLYNFICGIMNIINKYQS